jgi:hypothetical protein
LTADKEVAMRMSDRTERKVEELQFDGCQICGTNDERFEIVAWWCEGDRDGLSFETEVECQVCGEIDEVSGFDPGCVRCHGLGLNVFGYRDYAGDPILEACGLCQWAFLGGAIYNQRRSS